MALGLIVLSPPSARTPPRLPDCSLIRRFASLARTRPAAGRIRWPTRLTRPWFRSCPRILTSARLTSRRKPHRNLDGRESQFFFDVRTAAREKCFPGRRSSFLLSATLVFGPTVQPLIDVNIV